jgi:hypothetical protein
VVMTELAPEPAVTAGEATTLNEFLDYYRSVLLRKVDGLDEAQVRVRIPPSEMDLLGMIRHMAFVEQWWFASAFAGSDEPARWLEPDDDDRDWHHRPDETLAEALEALHFEIDRARAIVAASTSLDDLTAIEVGPVSIPERRGKRSLRWIMVHMIEEYARHCGHADLLREVVDGTTGD